MAYPYILYHKANSTKSRKTKDKETEIVPVKDAWWGPGEYKWKEIDTGGGIGIETMCACKLYYNFLSLNNN